MLELGCHWILFDFLEYHDLSSLRQCSKAYNYEITEYLKNSKKQHQRFYDLIFMYISALPTFQTSMFSTHLQNFEKLPRMQRCLYDIDLDNFTKVQQIYQPRPYNFTNLASQIKYIMIYLTRGLLQNEHIILEIQGFDLEMYNHLTIQYLRLAKQILKDHRTGKEYLVLNFQPCECDLRWCNVILHVPDDFEVFYQIVLRLKDTLHKTPNIIIYPWLKTTSGGAYCAEKVYGVKSPLDKIYLWESSTFEILPSVLDEMWFQAFHCKRPASEFYIDFKTSVKDPHTRQHYRMSITTRCKDTNDVTKHSCLFIGHNLLLNHNGQLTVSRSV